MPFYRPWEYVIRPVEKLQKEIERTYKKVVEEVSRPEFYMTSGGAAVGGIAGGYTGAAIGAGVGYTAGSGALANLMSPPPMPPIQPTSRLGPAPTTIMAGERAALSAEQLRKKRRRLSVMGGDYGQLTTTQQKLGT